MENVKMYIGKFWKYSEQIIHPLKT